MRNSYFQFKQFTIQQDRCAMKVTTDSCLFGAIVAKEIRVIENCQVLDIGTGTGLFSLMVAQENGVVLIDAVEIEKAAAEQAAENINASPWSDRVTVIQEDILQYQSTKLYDTILSNPPFYEQQLASPNTGRKLAHHSSELSLQRLFEKVVCLLKEEGRFYLLLPFYRKNEAVELAKSEGLMVEKQWLVKQTPNHTFFRVIFCFSKTSSKLSNAAEIMIRNEADQYTPAFLQLLQPFYLHL